MKIIITGGTGLIGGAFSTEALHRGHQIINLSRNPSRVHILPGVETIQWDGRTPIGWQDQVESADAILNLAGANIGASRWTTTRKREIRDSRLNAGEAVLQAFHNARRRPKLLMQASAVGYYGNTQDDSVVQESAMASSDYLGQLCVEWENSTRGVEELGVRRVVLRTGLVLTKNAGALQRLLPQYNLLVGGPLGNGKQWWPWIHLKDQVLAMLFLLENELARGPFNLTAPSPVRMQDFGKTLAKVLGRPYWAPVPAFGLKMLLGEMSKIVLEGQRAVPTRLLELGYSFQFSDLEMALRNV